MRQWCGCCSLSMTVTPAPQMTQGKVKSCEQSSGRSIIRGIGVSFLSRVLGCGEWVPKGCASALWALAVAVTRAACLRDFPGT